MKESKKRKKQKNKIDFDIYEKERGRTSRLRVESYLHGKKSRGRIILFGTILISTIVTVLIFNKLEVKNEDIVRPFENIRDTIIEITNPDDEKKLKYDPNYITEEMLEREEKHFDYYDYTEEEYIQFNDITTYDILTPDSEEELFSKIYSYCSEGNFIDAYQLLEAYVFEEDVESRKEKFYSLREDLNTMAIIKGDDFNTEILSLITYINDPELLLYSFYDLDLREQKEIVSIKYSDILPLPRSFLKVLEKVQIRPSELPNFSKQYNSISIKGKEIWRLEVAIGKHNIPEHYVYIIIDTENPGRNKVYYIEAQDNGLWVPTKYDQLR